MNNTQLILRGIFGALLIDFHTYNQSKKENPEAKFDFVLSGMRILMGIAVSYLYMDGKSLEDILPMLK